MKVAINGLGRIGRIIFKRALEKGIDIVAVNDRSDTKTLAYLLKYDSIHGVYDKKVEAGRDYLKVNRKKILVFSKDNPEQTKN